MFRRSGAVSGENNPPPVPRPKRDAGFTWALVGCGALLLIFVVGIGMALSLAPKSGFRSMLDSATSAANNGSRLLALRDALEQYRKAHHEAYPAKIQELVPDYLPEETLNDLKEKGLEYSAPKPNATDDTVVASVRGGSGDILGQKQTTFSRLLKDDRIVMDQVTRTLLYQRGKSKTANPFAPNASED